MSIASYKMATSPYDSNNKNVLDWLDRMETSVRMAGRSAGPSAYKDMRGGTTAIDDEDSGEEESHTQRFGPVPPDDDDQTVGDGDHTVADEKLFSLPDSHVPLGLIANLSLDSNKGKKVRKDSKDIAGAEESLDDDDVVSSSYFRNLLLEIDYFAKGVANETYFLPGASSVQCWFLPIFNYLMRSYRSRDRSRHAGKADRTTQPPRNFGARAGCAGRC